MFDQSRHEIEKLNNKVWLSYTTMHGEELVYMEKAYQRLHDAGFAFSIESYVDGDIAGGLYGVTSRITGVATRVDEI